MGDRPPICVSKEALLRCAPWTPVTFRLQRNIIVNQYNDRYYKAVHCLQAFGVRQDINDVCDHLRAFQGSEIARRVFCNLRHWREREPASLLTAVDLSVAVKGNRTSSYAAKRIFKELLRRFLHLLRKLVGTNNGFACRLKDTFIDVFEGLTASNFTLEPTSSDPKLSSKDVSISYAIYIVHLSSQNSEKCYNTMLAHLAFLAPKGWGMYEESCRNKGDHTCWKLPAAFKGFELNTDSNRSNHRDWAALKAAKVRAVEKPDLDTVLDLDYEEGSSSRTKQWNGRKRRLVTDDDTSDKDEEINVTAEEEETTAKIARRENNSSRARSLQEEGTLSLGPTVSNVTRRMVVSLEKIDLRAKNLKQQEKETRMGGKAQPGMRRGVGINVRQQRPLVRTKSKFTQEKVLSIVLLTEIPKIQEAKTVQEEAVNFGIHDAVGTAATDQELCATLTCGVKASKSRKGDNHPVSENAPSQQQILVCLQKDVDMQENLSLQGNTRREKDSFMRGDTSMQENTFMREDASIQTSPNVQEDPSTQENSFMREDMSMQENADIQRKNFMQEDTSMQGDDRKQELEDVQASSTPSFQNPSAPAVVDAEGPRRCSDTSFDNRMAPPTIQEPVPALERTVLQLGAVVEADNEACSRWTSQPFVPGPVDEMQREPFAAGRNGWVMIDATTVDVISSSATYRTAGDHTNNISTDRATDDDINRVSTGRGIDGNTSRFSTDSAKDIRTVSTDRATVSSVSADMATDDTISRVSADMATEDTISRVSADMATGYTIRNITTDRTTNENMSNNSTDKGTDDNIGNLSADKTTDDISRITAYGELEDCRSDVTADTAADDNSLLAAAAHLGTAYASASPASASCSKASSSPVVDPRVHEVQMDILDMAWEAPEVRRALAWHFAKLMEKYSKNM